jgi:hypothetical protein
MIAATLILTCLVGAPPDEPIVLDSRKQLFLDDYLLASSSKVRRQVHPAHKHPANPVLRATEPWENDVAIVYGSVLEEGGKYRTWYYAAGNVGYAESNDGIAWTKPRLGIVQVEGRDTNLVIDRDAGEGQPGHLPYFYEIFGVHRDERDPDPQRRYKMGFLSIHRDYRGTNEDPFHRGQRRGLGVAVSADGIHWQLVDNWATEAICDGGTHWMWDDRLGRYVLYGRTKHIDAAVVQEWGQNEWVRRHYWGRSVARVESEDFVQWAMTRPGSAPVVMAADRRDPPGTEIYSMSVFPYESVYIGLVQVFHNQPDACYLDIQLAVSHDSIHFARVGDRAAFLPVGPVGSWDRFNHSMANNPPILEDDRLRFYYGGRTYRHSPYGGADKGERGGAIGLATIPRDRFVSLGASFDEGTIVTRPVRIKGGQLRLNAKADFGRIIVEVLGPDGQTVARSEPISEDSLEIPVRWESGSVNASAMPVTLRITLQNALVFALWAC